LEAIQTCPTMVIFHNVTCNDSCTLNWNFDDWVSNWEGITVSNGSVLQINLFSKDLSGDIPDLNLPNLTRLALPYNNFTKIPVLTNLPNLNNINLSSNQLSGCFEEALVPLCDIYYNFNNNVVGLGSCAPTNPSDSLELIKLYNATCNEGCMLDWDFNELVNSWTGIAVRKGRVTEIDLPSKNLSGNIPNLNLPELTDLILSNNNLEGGIPEISQLSVIVAQVVVPPSTPPTLWN